MLRNASGGCICVVCVCRDVDISMVGRRSLQTFLVTSTNANNLVLGLPWFISVGARMIVAGKCPVAQVAISIMGEDGTETTVKAIFSDDPMRIPQSLMMIAKN